MAMRDEGGERAHVVMDLGAGVGKVVAAAVLTHGAAKGIGVELSPTRFEAGCAALRALERWKGDGPFSSGSSDDDAMERRAMDVFRQSLNSPVEIVFREGDVVEADFSGVTRVVVFATCFPAWVAASLQVRGLCPRPPSQIAPSPTQSARPPPQRRMADDLMMNSRVFIAGDAGSWLPVLVSNSSSTHSSLRSEIHSDGHHASTPVAVELSTQRMTESRLGSRSIEALLTGEERARADRGDVASMVWVVRATDRAVGVPGDGVP